MAIALCMSCENRPADLNSATKESHAELDFDWMLGNWIRVNEDESKTTFESWKKQGGSHYVGFGYTMQGNDTVWQESVALIKTNGSWSFDVQGKGETHPTKFRLTAIQEGKFVCEEQVNEFPKKIEYWKNNEELQARISGGDVEVLFVFEKNGHEK